MSYLPLFNPIKHKPTKVTSTKITSLDCLQALKRLAVSSTAGEIAGEIENYFGLGCLVSPRAVATALRIPTRDGRVKINFRNKKVDKRGVKGVAKYKFIRMSPKVEQSSDLARSTFEQFAEGQHMNLVRTQPNGIRYVNPTTEKAWLAFQVAWKSAPKLQSKTSK